MKYEDNIPIKEDNEPADLLQGKKFVIALISIIILIVIGCIIASVK